LAEDNCKAALDGSAPVMSAPEPLAPTVLLARAQISPAEGATAEGLKAKLKAATPAEAAIKLDPGIAAKKNRKRKSDGEQTDAGESDATSSRRSSVDSTKNGGAAKKPAEPSKDESPVSVVKMKPPSPIVVNLDEDESRIDDPAESQEESTMPIETMRSLLSTLLTRISAPERLESFGHGKILVDKVLLASIESSGRTAIRDPSLSERECLIRNIQILLEWTIPKQYMDCFKKERRSTEDLLEELTS